MTDNDREEAVPDPDAVREFEEWCYPLDHPTLREAWLEATRRERERAARIAEAWKFVHLLDDCTAGKSIAAAIRRGGSDELSMP